MSLPRHSRLSSACCLGLLSPYQGPSLACPWGDPGTHPAPIFLFDHRWQCWLSLSGQCPQPQLPPRILPHSGARQLPRAARGMEASKVSGPVGKHIPCGSESGE